MREEEKALAESLDIVEEDQEKFINDLKEAFEEMYEESEHT